MCFLALQRCLLYTPRLLPSEAVLSACCVLHYPQQIAPRPCADWGRQACGLYKKIYKYSIKWPAVMSSPSCRSLCVSPAGTSPYCKPPLSSHFFVLNRLVPAPVAADRKWSRRLEAAGQVVQRFRCPPITAVCPAQPSWRAAASQRQQDSRWPSLWSLISKIFPLLLHQCRISHPHRASCCCSSTSTVSPAVASIAVAGRRPTPSLARSSDLLSFTR